MYEQITRLSATRKLLKINFEILNTSNTDLNLFNQYLFNDTKTLWGEFFQNEYWLNI